VRGWTVVAALLLIAGQRSLDNLPSAGDWMTRMWWQALAVLVVVALAAFGYAALAWRMTAYAIDSDSVRLHTGILFRQQRKARLDRLQAVDLVQPLVARIFGLAELKIEVAGGTGSGVRLGFLKIEEAERLRKELLARAAGISLAPQTDTDPAAPGAPAAAPRSQETPDLELALPDAPERPLTQVPPGRLVGSILASGAFVFAILGLLGIAGVLIGARQPGALVPALPIMFGFGAYVFNRFTGEYGFRSAISPDGIRLRHGLLETRSQTIPPGRVQALRLTQGPLWRRQDWWRVDVNVAGYVADGDSGSAHTNILLPVGSREDALVAVWLVLPDLGAEDPRALLAEALTGAGAGAFFTVPPRRARWLDPIVWRRTGVAVTDRALVIRTGRIVRRVVIVPHERTQSLGVQQGPWQRRLSVATFAVHSTPGPIAPAVPHLASSDAAALMDQQAARARRARAQAGPELWMRRDEVPS
jgi:putative membrane protein